jgi:fructose-1,6-bisphosphatase I
MSLIGRNVLTLDEFTIQQLRDFPHATGELSRLLRDIGLAAKRVNVEVNKAGLVDILGDFGTWIFMPTISSWAYCGMASVVPA